MVHPRSHFGQSRVCHEGLPCLPLADVYEVVSSKTTVFIMYIQVSQWHPPLIWEFFVVVAVIAVAALMLLLLYTCSLQLQFFDFYRPLCMTRLLDALPHLFPGVLLSRKKHMFRIEVPYTNTNGVNLNHPRWHPCPLQGWNTYWKKKAQLDPTCMLSQLYRLLDFYGAAPHSWQEPVKPFLKIKPFWGSQELSWMLNNWVLTYDLNIYPDLQC